MKRATLILCAIFVLPAGCATVQGKAERASLDFALIGDMPYDGRQEKEFANLMTDIDAADLAFVVHNGDFWWDGAAWTEKAGGLPPCSDETFDDRLALASRSRHPFIYAAVSLILLITSLLACVIPTWRAVRVDPMLALRQE